METIVKKQEKFLISDNINNINPDKIEIDQLIDEFKALSITQSFDDDNVIDKIIDEFKSLSLDDTQIKKKLFSIIETIKLMLQKPKCVSNDNIILSTNHYIY